MATEGGREYVPQLGVEGVTERDVMRDARQSNLVIECTGAAGVTHSFTHTGVAGLWACHRSDMTKAWLTDPDHESTIENCIRRCDPDVRLIDEDASAFGGDSVDV